MFETIYLSKVMGNIDNIDRFIKFEFLLSSISATLIQTLYVGVFCSFFVMMMDLGAIHGTSCFHKLLLDIPDFKTL